MPFHETIATINAVARKLHFSGCYANPIATIETNGFQDIYAQFLTAGGLDVKSIKSTTDKRSRVALTSPAVESGFILFPREGAEHLIAQLTGHGSENHDDLSDAFAIMFLGSLETTQTTQNHDAFLSYVETNGWPCF